MKYEAFFWLALLSCTTSYVAWTAMRVWLFRMDLFNIRDRLWLEMYRAGDLANPAHREAASTINGIIQLAPMMSFATLIQIDQEERSERSSQVRLATLPDAPKPVRKAVHDSVVTLATYLVRGGILGWSVYTMFRLMKMLGWLDGRVTDFSNRLLFSRRVRQAGDRDLTHSGSQLCP